MSNPSRRTAIATAALALTTPVSLAQGPPKTTATSKPPPEIQSLINSHIKAFNTEDNEPFFHACSGTPRSSLTGLRPTGG